jgi:hypothetical protein
MGLLFVAIATLYVLLLALTRPPVPVLFAIVGVALLMYGFGLRRVRDQGVSVSQAQRVIWREPSWWPFWYPRALRRRGNVWDRLPSAVRHMRWWFSAAGGIMAVFSVLIVGSFALRSKPTIAFLAMTVGTLTAIMTSLWPILRARALRELRRSGLAPADAHRVMMTASLSRAAFWGRAHISAGLAPVPREGSSARGSDSPHDQLQSVLRNADGLSGPLRALGTQAAAAARQLLVSIEHADREIAELARSLDPGEEERLTGRIRALGDTSAEVRGLLEKQLDLVRRLQARIDEGREERNRRIEMLKTLALHLASLRAGAAKAPADVPSLSERVRRLCGEIDGQALALAEARAAAARVEEAPTRARSL